MNLRSLKKAIRSFKRDFFNYLKKILIMSTVTVLITLIICYFFDWTTIEQISTTLTISYIALIALGGMSIMGSMSFRGSMNYQISRTTSGQSAKSRTDEDLDSTDKSIRFAIFMICSAILPAILSIILNFFK